MYTSYFGNLKNVVNPLAISLYKPKWFKGPHEPRLAPTSEILKEYKSGHLTTKDYIIRFHNDVLQQHNPIDLYQELVDKYGSDVTLLCYEKDGFCHRHLVALWFENSLNVVIPELGV